MRYRRAPPVTGALASTPKPLPLHSLAPEVGAGIERQGLDAITDGQFVHAFDHAAGQPHRRVAREAVQAGGGGGVVRAARARQVTGGRRVALHVQSDGVALLRSELAAHGAVPQGVHRELGHNRVGRTAVRRRQSRLRVELLALTGHLVVESQVETALGDLHPVTGGYREYKANATAWVVINQRQGQRARGAAHGRVRPAADVGQTDLGHDVGSKEGATEAVTGDLVLRTAVQHYGQRLVGGVLELPGNHALRLALPTPGHDHAAGGRSAADAGDGQRASALVRGDGLREGVPLGAGALKESGPALRADVCSETPSVKPCSVGHTDQGDTVVRGTENANTTHRPRERRNREPGAVCRASGDYVTGTATGTKWCPDAGSQPVVGGGVASGSRSNGKGEWM
eukprot:ctg_1147.g232